LHCDATANDNLPLVPEDDITSMWRFFGTNDQEDDHVTTVTVVQDLEATELNQIDECESFIHKSMNSG